MIKTIGLVGHCGPDASYLRLALSRATKDAQIVAADDQQKLQQLLNDGVDLLLVNRQLAWGFETTEGIQLIQILRERHPLLRTMLISNLADAQKSAIEAGALPGFGKRELGTPRVTELLRAALAQ